MNDFKRQSEGIIKIVIADDQNLYKVGLNLVLKKYPHLAVVGEASDDLQLIEHIVEKQPDIVLIDLYMGHLDCVALIRKILSLNPRTGIVVLSQHEENALIIDVIEAGVAGYLSKDATEDEICDAVEEVYNGGNYYCKRITTKVIQLLGESSKNKVLKKRGILTKTEEAIIQEICNELTNQEIAAKLYLSVRTVEGHRLKILRKIQAKGTAGIVVHAIKYGIYKMEWQMQQAKLLAK